VTSRTIATLAGIVVVVGALSAFRCACRVEPTSQAGVVGATAAATPGEGARGTLTGNTARPPAVPGLPRVLDFGRGECIPCKKMKPVLDQLAALHEGKVVVRIYDLKDEESRTLAGEHRVQLIPTQVFLDAEGKERFRHEGFISLADLEAELARLGWTR